MKRERLHIVSFDIPWPADYGGAIDVFYRIRILKKLGIKVHLHCFTYGRKPANELTLLCENVTYYQRKTGLLSNLSREPYISRSRRSNKLLNNLLLDDSPILFEGIHSCHLLNHHTLKKRIKAVRTHNIEHDYYKQLAHSEPTLLKRLFHKIEAVKLKRFEPILQSADLLFSISSTDFEWFEKQYPQVKQILMPPSFSYDTVDIDSGVGNYALYHGNLEVSENIEAAKFLIAHVFSKVDFPCIIAGKNPSDQLKKLAAAHSNITLKSNPSHLEMDTLVKRAQLHVLPTFQPTGLKLKLLNTLFRGRYCLVNLEMISGTGLKNSCIVCTSAEAFIDEINHYSSLEFSVKDIKDRTEQLNRYSNFENGKRLIKALKLTPQEG